MLKMDCHIHTERAGVDGKALLANMKKSGLDGGTIISVHPDRILGATGMTWEQRLDDVLITVQDSPALYPFFFLDPTEADACEQITEAVGRGIRGFKVICSHFFPGDPRAMKAYRQIAGHGLPIMFHSGILYDGVNASGRYNRPCEFEPLLAIEGLTFSLAHISWPWTDECIAVFGKLSHYRRHTENERACADMYIDLTPGTPGIYRKDALARVLSAGGSHAATRILWGDDNCTNSFDAGLAAFHVENDLTLLGELADANEAAQIAQMMFHDNYMRFVGASKRM